ncbi:MAG TPA: Fur family transcriptional regulator [Chloroflexota bacterium]|nr:Fur family transcriptional regulator [Chloroflexota bacterium]
MRDTSPSGTGESLTEAAILSVLDAAGLRHTRPRATIIRRVAEYAAVRGDFAIEDLWQTLQDEQAQIGRATLFRAVETMVSLGVLDRIELADGSPRYRVCSRSHHHHLICVSCRSIEEIDVCLPEAEIAAAAAAAGFAVERHSLELYGRCAECRTHETSAPGADVERMAER